MILFSCLIMSFFPTVSLVIIIVCVFFELESIGSKLQYLNCIASNSKWLSEIGILLYYTLLNCLFGCFYHLH